MSSPSVVSAPPRPSAPRAHATGVAAHAPVVGAMILGILALYCPLALFGGGQSVHQSVLGIDYNNIHERRIRYAQEALAASGGHLPAWYTRELMGSPFWSNIQSFPFLPTRLAVLWIDPAILFPVAVNLAAILAAFFTYLYLGKLGLGRVASAVGGWTFAASGYFASRVLAGHLPLIEAFGALPLLLWCLESIAQSPRGDPRLWLKLVGLAVASLCVVLCGHPQVPAYAMGTAVLYALVRMWGRSGARALLAMALGVGLSGLAWWPMLRLIGRSTRILSLDRPGNDLAFPYWRLKAFLFPWADGWPSAVLRLPANDFVDPNTAYFWDTVCYVGWIPILAALFLLGRSLVRRRLPAKPWLLLAVVATCALVLALPFAQSLTSQFRVTLLRSPSRMLYLTTFALAAAIAVFVDELLRTRKGLGRALCSGLAVVLLAAHAVDLGSHARSFIHLVTRLPRMDQEIDRWRRNIGQQRFAFDCWLFAPANRAVDDVGFFDSIMLARPYRAFLALNGSSPQTNTQTMDGSTLPAPALAGLCAKVVISSRPREDLHLMEAQEFANAYAVPDPLPRATFFPDTEVTFLDDAHVLDLFREGTIDFKKRMFLDPTALPSDLRRDAASSSVPSAPVYDRPDSDEIVVRIDAHSAGFVRVMETWDEGWSATLDSRPTDVRIADTFAMAVRVPAGVHEVRLTYRTQGAFTGLALTAISALLLAWFGFRIRTGP